MDADTKTPETVPNESHYHSKKVRVFATVGTENVRLLDLKDVAVADGKITANAVLSEAAAAKLNTTFPAASATYCLPFTA